MAFKSNSCTIGDVRVTSEAGVADCIYDDGNYELLLILAQIDSLKTRREHLTSRFFKRQVLDNNSVLNYLLPPKHNLEENDKLRHVKPYELVKMRTDRFVKSFISYCLATYQ